MTVLRCQWCPNPATAKCTVKIDGKTMNFPFCRPDSPCWEKTYQAVRAHTPRTWTGVVQAEPDLFDLLPD